MEQSQTNSRLLCICNKQTSA